MRKLSLILLTLWLISCEQDEVPVPVGIIPNELQPLVDRFVWEAQKRGLTVDASHLSFEYERNIPGGTSNNPVVGSCTRLNGLDLIKLDTINSLWLLSGKLGREEIVFHELGHCLLNRSHNDVTLASGDYASIMRTVGLLQYGDLNNFTSLFTGPIGVKAHRRDYYLEELFQQEADVPCWSDPNISAPYPITIFEHDFIKNNEVRHLWLDPQENLWIYGNEKSYIYEAGSFNRILTELEITSLAADNSGTVWVAAIIDGLPVVGTYNAGNFDIKYRSESFPSTVDRINQMVIDDLDRFWASTNNGHLFVNSGVGFVHANAQDQTRVFQMKKGPGNSVYMLKGGQLYVYQDPQTFTKYDQGNTDLPTDFFWNFEIDHEGTAWLLPSRSTSSLIQFRSDKQVTQWDFYEINLAEMRINDMTISPSGDLWIASSNGIKRWEGNTFSNYCKYNTGLDLVTFGEIVVRDGGTVWSIGRNQETLDRQLVLSEPGL